MIDIPDPTLPAGLARTLGARPLRLGTRASPLAMAQAKEVRQRLTDVWHLPQSSIELAPVTASGDKVQNRALREIGGKALWTKELDRALYEGEIDFSVHSMKDVETVRPVQLAIAAILKRADARDVLVGAASIEAIPHGGRFGTSSPRRAAQMLHVRPDLDVVLFRGNVASRLAKLERGEADATLLAAAGLVRLGHGDVGTPLSLDQWLPAASQGAIGVETRAEDADMLGFLGAIDHGPSAAALQAERAFLEALAADCHSPVAAHASASGSRLDLRTAIYSTDGALVVEDAARFSSGDTEAPKRLARQMLETAPQDIRKLFAGAIEGGEG